MHVTLGQLNLAWPVLRELNRQKFPVQVSYRLARLQRAIAPEVDILEEERGKLAREFGQAQEDGSWMVPKEQVPAFTARYEQLLAVETDVDVLPIPLAALPDSIRLSPADMLALDFLFVEET